MPTRVERARAALLRAEHADAVRARVKPLKKALRALERAEVDAHEGDRELVGKLRDELRARVQDVEAP